MLVSRAAIIVASTQWFTFSTEASDNSATDQQWTLATPAATINDCINLCSTGCLQLLFYVNSYGRATCYDSSFSAKNSQPDNGDKYTVLQKFSPAIPVTAKNYDINAFIAASTLPPGTPFFTCLGNNCVKSLVMSSGASGTRAADGSICISNVNAYTCDANNLISVCLPGFVFNVKTTTSAFTCTIPSTSCNPGQKLVSGACVDCLDGSWSKGNTATTCTSCIARQVSNCDRTNGWTTACDPGNEIKNPFTASAYCGQCSYTSYSTYGGRDPCTSCGINGAQCKNPTSPIIAACTQGVGIFVPATSNSLARCDPMPTSCEAGQDLTNSCRDCKPYFWSKKGDSQCTWCSSTVGVATCDSKTGVATSCVTHRLDKYYGLSYGQCVTCLTNSIPDSPTSRCPCPTGAWCVDGTDSVCRGCLSDLVSTKHYRYNRAYQCCPPGSPFFTGFGAGYGCQSCKPGRGGVPSQCSASEDGVLNTIGNINPPVY